MTTILPEPLPHLDAHGAASVSPAWMQGRTLYGGASAALALQAAKALAGDLPPLRSAQIAFVGPLADTVSTTATLLRRGKNSAWIAVDVVDADGGTGLRALFLFMAPRASSLDHRAHAVTIAMPPPAPWPPFVPRFVHNFDLRELPCADGFHRWARFAGPPPSDAEVALIAIADLLPPAALRLATTLGPVSSCTWQINLVGAPGAADDWYRLEARTADARDGGSTQMMTIWRADGTVQATGTQSVALFL